jgi:uncharacterized glyoxalase superfamily protein PhnB
MPVRPVPEGYHTVTPYLIVDGADRLLAFLKAAFGAREHDVTRHDDGSIWHADVLIGDSHVMLSQATTQYPAREASLYLYVPNTDVTYRAALAAGATSVMEPADQFYGDRNAGVRDPFGITYWIGTHVEDVPPDEMERRVKVAAAKRAQAQSSRA